MRSSLVGLAAVIVTPWAVVAQAPDVVSRPEPASFLTVSLDDNSALPRLGVWRSLNDRFTLGLEVESGVQSWTMFGSGDPSRAESRRDWRFAVGPAATLRLARRGPLDLMAYGAASWGAHAFDVRRSLADEGGVAESGLGLRGGLALDWSFAPRWSVGAMYTARWTSEPGRIGPLPRDHWRKSGLGFSLKFRF